MDKKMSQTESINSGNQKSHTKYTADFKAQILEVWNSGTYSSIAECARSYKIPENTLYTWLNKANKDPILVNNDAEILSLKKELSRTKMELEILKKAAIYFANHAR